MKKKDKISLSYLIVLCLLSVVRYADNNTFALIDILSNFPFQYALLSLTLMVYSLWKKRIFLAIMAGILLFINAFAIFDLERSIHAAGHAGNTFRVYSANLNIANDDLARLNYELHEMEPEMILLMEVTQRHIDQMQPIMKNYPHRIKRGLDGEGEIGMVFLSKFPVHNYDFTRLSDFGNSLLKITLEIDRKSVVFYGIHAQRPDKVDFNERKMQLFDPARQIREQSLPAIFAGDFNMTPYSPVFKQLVNIASLKDSREGFGWQPSWPAFFPPLWIPIDHILVTPDIQVLKRITGSYIGSDHYPVIAELSLG